MSAERLGPMVDEPHAGPIISTVHDVAAHIADTVDHVPEHVADGADGVAEHVADAAPGVDHVPEHVADGADGVAEHVAEDAAPGVDHVPEHVADSSSEHAVGRAERVIDAVAYPYNEPSLNGAVHVCNPVADIIKRVQALAEKAALTPLGPGPDRPSCPAGRCDGHGYEETPGGVRPCVCLIDRERRRILGPRFVGATFERLEADVAIIGGRPHPTLLRARDVMAANPGGSFLVHGDFGAFKTYLAASQFNALVDRRGLLSVVYVTDMDLFRSLRDAELDQGRPRLTPADIAYRRFVHLIIDDLGKKSVSPFVRQAYFEIIDAVHRRGGDVGLTITSNLTPEGLLYDGAGAELYDAGMVRRIEEMCTVFEVRR